MLSSSFWYGFVIGVGLVFLVFVVSRMIARSKKTGGS